MRRLLCGMLVVVAAALFASSAMAEPLGLQSLEVSASEAPPAGHEVDALGPEDVQAGSHPYALTTKFLLSAPEEVGSRRFRVAGGGLKDFRLELPPGFVGNPNATPKCPYALFEAYNASHVNTCPDDTAIGVATTKILSSTSNDANRDHAGTITVSNPVYNVETPGGVPFEFGFFVKSAAPVLVDASVRTGKDYGITAAASNITQAADVYESTVKIWGVPADPSHNKIRGRCLAEAETLSGEEEQGIPHNEEESEREAAEKFHREFGGGGPLSSAEEASFPAECPVDIPVRPLLTNPTSCGVSRTAVASVDFWEEPGVFTSRTTTLPELSGCEKLNFSPTLSVTPDGSEGSTPTGLNVDVHVPQESTVNPEGLGEADVKDTTVTLPEGVQLSPSAADGLQGCSDEQIGFIGVNTQSGMDEFSDSAPSCPDASKIANVRIVTPLLERELTGSVYLAAPQNFAGLPQNPFSSLIAMYLVAEEPATGVLVKLPGRVSLSETGQITSTFEDTPQLPFSDLKLEFYGTARAPLATPALCGDYDAESSFVPWSGTLAKNPPASFEITSGPDGSSCPNPPGDRSLGTLPFAPYLTAQMTNIQAGAFSPFTMTMSREDGNQNLQAISLKMPAGLSGILSGVELCPEPQADAGTCGPNSLIGETIVSVGLGNDPFSVTGGKVYITGPYEGAPFGLSIVNPAKAGPFILQEGHPVIVRAKIEVNPITAALTITSDNSGPYKIPQFIEGIPLQIKHVNVSITRPGFTFNPTSCNKMEIGGSLSSAEGASRALSVPFQAGECRSLAFEPKFSVLASGKNSKADGASLTAKVSYPNVSQGTDADIAYVKVELPKQLPSRLTTLQKACTSAQFKADPAGCPAASVIGHAIVHTPLLPVPLQGPAYFVSNGGEAFPNLIVVLQGYGVTVDLVGDTFISKAGVTSTTFKTVPDSPFSSFELTLPQGPDSALAANGNLCSLTRTVTVKKKVTVKVSGGHKRATTREVKQTLPVSLVMPNEFIGQNGAVIHESTKIGVTGCPKAKPVRKTKKRRRKRAAQGGKGSKKKRG